MYFNQKTLDALLLGQKVSSDDQKIHFFMFLKVIEKNIWLKWITVVHYARFQISLLALYNAIQWNFNPFLIYLESKEWINIQLVKVEMFYENQSK